MFAKTSVVLAFASASLVAAQGVSVNYPTLNQCATSNISFSSSNGPYYVAIVPAADPCNSESYAEFHDVYGTSVDYYVNLAQGTSVIVYILDASGTETFSDPYTVGGGDSSCIGGNSNNNNNNNYQPPADNNYQPPADNSNNNYQAPPPADNNNYQAPPPTDGTVQPASNDSPPNNDAAPVVVTESSPVVVTATDAPAETPEAASQGTPYTYSVDHSSNNSNSNSNPVNAASNPEDASGASTTTISLVTIALGAFTALAALL
jgi:hypothetical protein